MIAVLIGCGLTTAEAAALKVEQIQPREGHWVIADQNGKGGHIRTVPMPDWVKKTIDEWAAACIGFYGGLQQPISVSTVYEF